MTTSTRRSTDRFTDRFTRRVTFRRPAAWLAVSVFVGLAGCAVPYPVVQQQPTVVQTPAPVYQYPSQPYSSTQAAPVDYRRRANEALYTAEVLSVRAVLATPEQRCWIEREPVVQDRPAANVPGAVVGAVIGGILGHQIGGGTGQDIATVGGAVAGAMVGSSVGRDSYGNTVTQEVQRCTSVPSNGQPDYYDVTYTFRGITHRAQMTTPPGRTITVNAAGEPRI